MRRRRLLLGLAAGTGLAVAAAAIVASLPSAVPASHPAPRAAATTAPSASATPVAVPPSPAPRAKTTGAAAAVVTDFLKSSDSLSGRSADPAAFASVAAGAAQGELQAEALELYSNGWHVTGTPKVRSVTVLHESLNAARPTATIEVCVDSSDVVTRTSSGAPIAPPVQRVRRALNIFGLEYVKGGWVVTSHSFPDDPAC